MLTFFIVVNLVSCKKEKFFESVAPEFRKLEKVASVVGLKQMLNNASGSVGITNLKPFGPEQFLSGGGPSEIIGQFFDSEGNKITYGTLEVQGFNLNAGVFGYYYSTSADRFIIQDYFGNTQPVRLYASESNENLLFEQSIYLPHELFVHQPIERGTYRITQNTTLRWNPDPQNVNGIFILIDFLPDGERKQRKVHHLFCLPSKIDLHRRRRRLPATSI